MSAQLMCLRHAEQESPTWDLPSGRPGTPPDPPLTERGCQQAEAVAQALRETRPCKVFSSDAARARQTGRIIGSHLAVDVEVVPDLAEVSMGLGPWERGQRADVIERWIVCGNLNARLPGGETGQQVKVRMERALNDIASRCQDAPGIVVGHVASLTVGVGSLCCNGPALWGRPLLHATPFELTLSGEGWHVEWPVP